MNKLKLLSLGLNFLLNASFCFNNVDIEALSSFSGKWRGKGYFVKNKEKENFDITQWVNDPRNQRINLYGFTKSNNSTHLDFNKSIFLSKENTPDDTKLQISFYLKDNFLVLSPLLHLSDNAWQFSFEDEKEVKYRCTWILESDNIWVETGEMQVIKDWQLISKVVMTKQ
jgi:hypothetical protein